MTQLNSDKIKELEKTIEVLSNDLASAHSRTRYERGRADELRKERDMLQTEFAKFKARILSVDRSQFDEVYTMQFSPSLYYRMPGDERRKFLGHMLRDMLRQVMENATCIEELYAKQPRHE